MSGHGESPSHGSNQANGKNHINSFLAHHIDGIIIVIAILVRVYMTHHMYVNCSLHDLGSYMGLGTPGAGTGHLGYVEYLFEYHALPDFDPTSVSSFYNPPFYYIVSALVMGLLWAVNLPMDIIAKAPTIVSCVATCSTVVIIWKMLVELEVSARVRHVFLILAAFYPAGIWLSFTANNDALCVMLCLLSLLLVVMWRRRSEREQAAGGGPRLWSKSSWFVVGAGLSFGLACATKLSAGLVAPAIAAVFFLRIWDLRGDGRWKALVAPYACFLLIAAPLALAFPVRNLITYDIPISYVQEPGGPFFDADVTAADRLGLPTISQLESSHYDPYDISNEQNIWAQTLKTSLFDEYYVTGGGHSRPLMLLLTALAVILNCVLVVLACVGLFARRATPLWQRLLLGLGIAVVLISYVRFCFIYPCGFSQNFRYIAAGWLLIVVAAAKGLDSLISPHADAGGSRRFGAVCLTAMGVLVVLVAFLSVALYLRWAI